MQELIFTHLEQHAQQRPDEPFLINHDGTVYSWRDSAQQVVAIATSLSSILPKTGCKVSILAENSAEWTLAELGIMRAGHISAATFTTMTPDNFSYVIDFAEIELIFVGAASNWQKVRHTLPQRVTVVALPGVDVDGADYSFAEFIALGNGQKPPAMPALDDLSVFVFTSGTTGKPKAVMHSLRTIYQSANTVLQIFRQQGLSQRRFICYLPLAHIGEKSITVMHAILCGASIHYCENPQELLPMLRTVRPTMVVGVPRIWELLLQSVLKEFGESVEDLQQQLQGNNSEPLAAQIREFLGLDQTVFRMTGSALSPQAVKDWYHLFGAELMELFGQTELLPLTTHEVGRSTQGAGAGSAAPGHEVRISEQGEVLGRGPCAALGYYKNPEKTAETFVDGWVHTGDKGYLDDNGNLFIIGRVSDEFKTSKGKFVAPGPIESAFSKAVVVEQQFLYGLGLTQPVMLCTLGASAQDLTDQELQRQLVDLTETLNTTLESHERIGAIICSRSNWAGENGLLTHTHKIKKDQVQAHHQQQIDQAARHMAGGNRQTLFVWA